MKRNDYKEFNDIKNFFRFIDNFEGELTLNKGNVFYKGEQVAKFSQATKG